MSLPPFQNLVATIFCRSRAAPAESQRDSNHPAYGCEARATLGERITKSSTRNEISAKVFEQPVRQGDQKVMQPKRENQPTFFDLAVQQRGSTNRVLETIACEVDFT